MEAVTNWSCLTDMENANSANTGMEEDHSFISTRLASNVMALALTPFLCAIGVLIILGCFSQNIDDAQRKEKAAQSALKDSFVLCQTLLDSIREVTEY